MGIGLGILVGFFCNLIVAANSHSLDFRNEYEAISSAYARLRPFVWRFGIDCRIRYRDEYEEKRG